MILLDNEGSNPSSRTTAAAGLEDQNLSLNQIMGQKRAIEYLRGLQETSKYPKALLFYGPPGVGKLQTAKAFAAHINMIGDPVKDKRTLDLIEISEHPDIRVWEKGEGESSIRIETVRSFVEEAMNPKFEAPLRRVLIMGDIQEFPSHRQADALLKTVEDGLEDTIFIFTATSLGEVFNTLRSRLTPVRFNPLGKEDMTSILKGSLYQSHPDLDLAIQLSGGSLDKARLFMRPSETEAWSGKDMRARSLRLLKNLPKTPVHVLFKFIKAIPPNDLKLFLEVTESLLLDVLLTEEGLFSEVSHGDLVEDLVALSSQYKDIASMLNLVQETLLDLERIPSLQGRHHVSEMFLRIVDKGMGNYD